jgi:hypothetical protein
VLLLAHGNGISRYQKLRENIMQITNKNLSNLNAELIDELQSTIDEIGYTKTINICKKCDRPSLAEFVYAMYLNYFYRATIS